MLAATKSGLLPILKSKSGFHATGYISNNGDCSTTRKKLNAFIESVYESLQPVMDSDRLSDFLQPVEALQKNLESVISKHGNLAIFRNENYFRVMSIPVEVSDVSFVATSFHVKPLLRWLQSECHFHLLTVDKEEAHLYKGDSASLELLSSFQFAFGHRIDEGTRLLHWLRRHRGSAAPNLFFMGSLESVESRLSLESRRSLFADVVLSFDRQYESENVSRTLLEIRSVFAQRAKLHMQSNLIEFSVAEDERRVAKNLFYISKAVARGEVQKLMIASTTNVFGKIDDKSGALEIHPYDLDHEDDDILDDLAQAVIAQGGEVIVADESKMPVDQIAVAILKRENSGISESKKDQFLDQSDFEIGRIL